MLGIRDVHAAGATRVSVNGNHVLSGGSDGVVALFVCKRWPQASPLWARQCHSAAVTYVSLHADLQLALSCGRDGLVVFHENIFDSADAATSRVVCRVTGEVRCLCFDAANRRVFIAGDSLRCLVMQGNRFDIHAIPLIIPHPIIAMSLSPCGHLMALASAQGSVGVIGVAPCAMPRPAPNQPSARNGSHSSSLPSSTSTTTTTLTDINSSNETSANPSMAEEAAARYDGAQLILPQVLPPRMRREDECCYRLSWAQLPPSHPHTLTTPPHSSSSSLSPSSTFHASAGNDPANSTGVNRLLFIPSAHEVRVYRIEDNQPDTARPVVQLSARSLGGLREEGWSDDYQAVVACGLSPTRVLCLMSTAQGVAVTRVEVRSSPPSLRLHRHTRQGYDEGYAVSDVSWCANSGDVVIGLHRGSVSLLRRLAPRIKSQPSTATAMRAKAAAAAAEAAATTVLSSQTGTQSQEDDGESDAEEEHEEESRHGNGIYADDATSTNSGGLSSARVTSSTPSHTASSRRGRRSHFLHGDDTDSEHDDDNEEGTNPHEVSEASAASQSTHKSDAPRLRHDTDMAHENKSKHNKSHHEKDVEDDVDVDEDEEQEDLVKVVHDLKKNNPYFDTTPSVRPSRLRDTVTPSSLNKLTSSAGLLDEDSEEENNNNHTSHTKHISDEESDESETAASPRRRHRPAATSRYLDDEADEADDSTVAEEEAALYDSEDETAISHHTRRADTRAQDFSHHSSTSHRSSAHTSGRRVHSSARPPRSSWNENAKESEYEDVDGAEASDNEEYNEYENNSSDKDNNHTADAVEYAAVMEDYSFQVGATPMGPEGTCYLAYNATGYIHLTRQGATVYFHDVSFPAVRIAQKGRILMGALSPSGAGFVMLPNHASHPSSTWAEGDELESNNHPYDNDTDDSGALARERALAKGADGDIDDELDEARLLVYFRTFVALGSEMDWRIRLPPGETVRCMTAGLRYLAVATSRHVRLYSLTGLELAVLHKLPHLVALAGCSSRGWATRLPQERDPLALIGRLGDGTHLCEVIDVGHREGIVAAHALPLTEMDINDHHTSTHTPTGLTHGRDSNRSTQHSRNRVRIISQTRALCSHRLQWLGWSETGVLHTVDTAGVVRCRVESWGGGWVTVYDPRSSTDALAHPHTALWVWAVSETMMCAHRLAASARNNTLPHDDDDEPDGSSSSSGNNHHHHTITNSSWSAWARQTNKGSHDVHARDMGLFPVALATGLASEHIPLSLPLCQSWSSGMSSSSTNSSNGARGWSAMLRRQLVSDALKHQGRCYTAAMARYDASHDATLMELFGRAVQEQQSSRALDLATRLELRDNVTRCAQVANKAGQVQLVRRLLALYELRVREKTRRRCTLPLESAFVSERERDAILRRLLARQKEAHVAVAENSGGTAAAAVAAAQGMQTPDEDDDSRITRSRTRGRDTHENDTNTHSYNNDNHEEESAKAARSWVHARNESTAQTSPPAAHATNAIALVPSYTERSTRTSHSNQGNIRNDSGTVDVHNLDTTTTAPLTPATESDRTRQRRIVTFRLGADGPNAAPVRPSSPALTRTDSDTTPRRKSTNPFLTKPLHHASASTPATTKTTTTTTTTSPVTTLTTPTKEVTTQPPAETTPMRVERRTLRPFHALAPSQTPTNTGDTARRTQADLTRSAHTETTRMSNLHATHSKMHTAESDAPPYNTELTGSATMPHARIMTSTHEGNPDTYEECTHDTEPSRDHHSQVTHTAGLDASMTRTTLMTHTVSHNNTTTHNTAQASSTTPHTVDSYAAIPPLCEKPNEPRVMMPALYAEERTNSLVQPPTDTFAEALRKRYRDEEMTQDDDTLDIIGDADLPSITLP